MHSMRRGTQKQLLGISIILKKGISIRVIKEILNLVAKWSHMELSAITEFLPLCGWRKADKKATVSQFPGHAETGDGMV